jgi:hypothetical protein
MKSHVYEIRPADIIRLALPSFVPVILFALIMHLGAKFRLLPAPTGKLDMDQTILVHQAEASQQRNSADLLLVGDSSCMMDISASSLNDQLPPGHRAFDLGTLSYLDLANFGELVQRYRQANPGVLRTVLVLVHPELLRRGRAESAHVATLAAMFQGTDFCDRTTPYGKISCLLGFEIFRGRLLSRLLPAPLPANWGAFYGFTTGLRRYLTLHAGSAVDPRQYTYRAGQGRAEYRLDPGVEAASRAFRGAVPPDVKLVVGLAPIPRSFAPPRYFETYQDLLIKWSEWMGADAALTNLPPTLPDVAFASTTHLNKAGAEHFTKILAPLLHPYLQPPSNK